MVRVLLPLSVIFVSPAPSTLRAASFLAVMLTLSSVTLRVLSFPVLSLFTSLLMMRMTFWAAALKLSAAVFRAVVDSFEVPSSLLALVYVNWLSGSERLLSVLSVPSAGVGVPPGLGAFFSPPVVRVSSALVSLPPEPVVPSEPVVPLSEPEVPSSEPLLSGSELPAPVFLPSVASPVWSFSVDWVSFSSPPPSEESLPLVSPG